MKKSLFALTFGLCMIAGTATADARSVAYEKMMSLIGIGSVPIAHDLANCPVYWANQDQLFAFNSANSDAELDAVLESIFEGSPGAVNCVFEVALRYDLFEADMPAALRQ